VAELVKIEGLREFQASLRRMDRDLPKQLRVVLNEAAEVVVEGARPKIPRRTGRAAASLRVQSSQRESRVAAGGARVPYYGWLDFGGSVGRKRSIRRPFLRDGRYIYPTFRDRRATFQRILEKGLHDLATKSGLDVT
jgi:hypothetical protein